MYAYTLYVYVNTSRCKRYAHIMDRHRCVMSTYLILRVPPINFSPTTYRTQGTCYNVDRRFAPISKHLHHKHKPQFSSDAGSCGPKHNSKLTSLHDRMDVKIQ